MVIGEHDAALLHDAAEYGFGRPDLLVKYVEKFTQIYEQSVAGDLTTRESRRKAAPAGDSLSLLPENSSGKYPVVDRFDFGKISWPNELIILRRLELIVEMMENSKSSSFPAKRKRGKKAKNALNDDDDVLNHEEDELALSAAKKKGARTSPTKAKKEAIVKKDPAAKKSPTKRAKIEVKAPSSPSKRALTRAKCLKLTIFLKLILKGNRNL